MLPDIDEFLSQKIISEATRETYVSILTRFGRWLDRSKLSFESLKTADVLRFVKEWGLGTSAGYQAVCAIRGYAAWKYGQNHPATKARVKRLESPPQRTLTAVQVEHLLKINSTSSNRAIRDFAVISLLVDSGLRESELCRLRLDQVDLEAKTLSVLGKGGKWGNAMYTERTVHAIQTWLDVRSRFVKEGVKTLFCSVGGNLRGQPLTPSGMRVIFRYISKRAGFTVSPHDLRRSFATLATERGAPTELVRRAGRWSSVEMVRIYTRQANVQAMRKYLPLYNESLDNDSMGTSHSNKKTTWDEE